MILIIDNGGIYSDHALWFVECSEAEARAVDTVLAWRQCAIGGHNTPYFVGKAQTVEWLAKSFVPMKPAEAIGKIMGWDLAYHGDPDDQIPRDVLSACATHATGAVKEEATRVLIAAFSNPLDRREAK